MGQIQLLGLLIAPLFVQCATLLATLLLFLLPLVQACCPQSLVPFLELLFAATNWKRFVEFAAA